MANTKPVTFDKAMTIRVNQEFFESLDEVRRMEPDLPNRTEMIKRLVERAAKRGKRK